MIMWLFGLVLFFGAQAEVGLHASTSEGAGCTTCTDDIVLNDVSLLQGQMRHSWEHSQSHSQHAREKEGNILKPFDPDLLDRSCLPDFMAESHTSLATVCSDDSKNNIKDDKGNYIQFTRREDKLMYNAWHGALQDCINGQSYVRDIVDGFAKRTSCFVNETTLGDDQTMYRPHKELINGVVVDTGTFEKEFCTGHDGAPNQTMLNTLQSLLSNLVDQWDNTELYNMTKLDVCREMLAAHTLHKYHFVSILKTTRPAACNATSSYGDVSLCQGANNYLLEFLNRDLFVNTDGGGFKGRAAEGENERAERCKNQILMGQPWNSQLTTNIGETVDEPKCTIDIPIQVFTEPVLKVGVWHENIGESLVADAYRQCGAPFLAGISATMPKYMASAAASPTKKGTPFEQALSLKEILTVMSMLELGGFHAVTGLTMAVNFYYKKLLVTPPFDSGDFHPQGESDGLIRCHDTVTNCCTNATKTEGFYNHHVYLNMIKQWENLVNNLWGTVV